MKQLILIFSLVVFTFAPVLNVQAKNDITYQKKEKAVKTTKNSVKIGYFVYVQKCDNVYQLKTESMAEVYTFIQVAYPDFCADLSYILERSPYYRENCFRREVYVEKMQINKRGKYKRIKHFKNYLK